MEYGLAFLNDDDSAQVFWFDSLEEREKRYQETVYNTLNMIAEGLIASQYAQYPCRIEYENELHERR